MKSFLKWSDKALAAQCVVPRLSADKYYSDKNYKLNIHELITLGVGGFCIFEGEVHNTMQMLQELQNMAETPLIFMADFENGLRMRLRDGAAFPHAMAMGQSGDTENTRKIAKAIAKEMKYLGVHVNLAPVCDINSNSLNPVINVRSFGEDAETVSGHVIAYTEALQEEKIIACAKHFPGHGDTNIDSHIDLPVINKDINELEKQEIIPFWHAVDAGVKSIMPGHLALPKIDSENIPASLSGKIINDYLIQKLKYTGLIISDALDMKAVSKNYTSAEAAEMAVNAGVDILLLPEDPIKTIESLNEKSKSEPVFRKKLENAANKIIAAKRWCGLTGLLPQANPYKQSTFFEHEKLALRVAHSAIKTTGNEMLMPIPEDVQIAGFAYMQSEDLDKGTTFFQMVAQAVENDADFGFIDENITPEQIEALKEKIKGAEIVIFAFFLKRGIPAEKDNIFKNLNEAVQDLSGRRRIISIFFGNPYFDKYIKSDLTIKTYSDAISSIAATVVKLSGRSLEQL